VKLKREKNAAPFFFPLSPTLSQPSKRLGEGIRGHPRKPNYRTTGFLKIGG